MPKTKVIKGKIVVNEAIAPDIAKTYFELQAEQAREGRNRNGELMGKDSQGKKIDIFRSGNLLYRKRSYTVSLDGQGNLKIEIKYETDYAEALDKKYQWLGLSEQKQEELTLATQRFIENNVEVEDE